MKLLTKDTDYAVRLIVYLTAHPAEFVSIRKVSIEERIPYYFLRRISKQLIERQMLKSKEGVRGGVKLVKAPSEIALLDMIKIFQGDLMLSECMFRKKICHNRPKCVLRKEILRIEQVVETEFKQLTIQTLIDKLSK
ncbi:MAG: Rrf2 family transcriptional regulator [Candidatus Omnitrophica bacterium]|nr:Rrf2 family transcriptional regulator [Candidatus Omnitrophota bacterium]